MKSHVRLLITISIQLSLTSCVSKPSNDRFNSDQKNGTLSIQINASECSLAIESKFKLLFQESMQMGISCLMKMGDDRKSDALALMKLVSEKAINLRCGKGAGSENIAIAVAKKFPGISIDPNHLSDLESSELKPVFFHESLHWLSYKHFDGIDLPYLAEACCFEYAGIAKNQSKQLACSMLDLRSEAWLTPDYNEKLTTVLSNFGRGFIGLRTAWNAAFYSSKNNSSKDAALRVLYASLKALNRGFYEPNSDQSTDLIWKKTENPTYGIIFGTIIQQASTPDLQRAAIKYVRALRNRFFSENKHNNSLKIDFFSSVSQSLEGLLLANPATIIKGWNKLSRLAHEVCPQLTKEERFALGNILAATYLDVFDLKGKLPANLLASWGKPCEFKAAF